MGKEEKFLDIYKYGDAILKLKADKVKIIDDQFIKLKQQMILTMHHSYSAIGLAAPQIGKSLQFSVIDTSRGENKDDLLVLINPEILEVEGSEADDEGCLSFPGIYVPVKRNVRIFLKSIDINGKEIRREIEGFLARVVQHEIDHLNGVLIIDRLSSLKRQMLKKEIKRLKNNGEW